jgi:hypothetical protein
MWMNESMPILWEMMPQAMHQALATFLPSGLPLVFTDESTARVNGAPVYAAVTIEPPRGDEGLSKTGTIRLEVQLNKRDTRPLGPQLFEAPPEYKKDSIQPVLKEWDEGIESVQSLFDEDTRLSDASAVSGAGPRYSWSAMRSVLRALRGAGAPLLK